MSNHKPKTRGLHKLLIHQKPNLWLTQPIYDNKMTISNRVNYPTSPLINQVELKSD